jgi:hypothetical protein
VHHSPMVPLPLGLGLLERLIVPMSEVSGCESVGRRRKTRTTVI